MADPSGTEGTEPEAGEESPVIKQLRKQAKTAEERSRQLERELAVHRAELTGLSTKQLAALNAIHEGEMTPDSLRATAEELGFLTAKPEAPAATTPLEETKDVAPDPMLAELARLAESPATEGTATQGAQGDLSQFTDNDAMFEFLRQNVPPNFGPSQ